VILLAEATTEKEKERKSVEKEMHVHTHQHVLEFLNAVVELKHKAIYIPGIYMLMEEGTCLIKLVCSIFVRPSRVLTFFIKGPGVGVDEDLAHCYFLQLISGMVIP